MEDILLGIIEAPESESEELIAVPQMIVDPSRSQPDFDLENIEEDEVQYRPTYTEETHQQRGTGLGTYSMFKSWPTKEEFFKNQFAESYNQFFDDDNSYNTIDNFSQTITNFYLKNPRLLAIAYYLKYLKTPLKRDAIKKALADHRITDVLDVNVYRYMMIL